MSNIKLRSKKERIIYALVFEILLLASLLPIGMVLFGVSAANFGILSLILSLKAMIFNFIFNWFYDRLDLRANRVPTERSLRHRVFHAVSFELGMLITSLPIIMWWLSMGLWEAFQLEVVLIRFVMIYTFLFGLGYDRLRPVAQ